MVTYSDLIQFCIFVIALVSLCYKIFQETNKNSRQLLGIVDGLLK